MITVKRLIEELKRYNPNEEIIYNIFTVADVINEAKSLGYDLTDDECINIFDHVETLDNVTMDSISDCIIDYVTEKE